MRNIQQTQNLAAAKPRDNERRDTFLFLDDVDLSYRHPSGGRAAVFAHLTISVAAGELVCVVGPSGCGKTTLLNIIGGLLPVDRGSVTLAGRPATEATVSRATVFQHPSLFPWRTILRNVAYGLEVGGRLSRAERLERCQDLLRLVGLEEYATAYPWQLSGGMQQRANLARALAVQPSLVLLDEPFSALDAQTREELQQEFMRIWTHRSATALFVTHDVEEAVYLADRVVIMSARPGRVVRDLPITLTRPRYEEMKYTADFADYVKQIREELRLQKG